MKSFAEVLADCVTRREELLHHGVALREQNTKSALIDPVITALGCDVHRPLHLQGWRGSFPDATAVYAACRGYAAEKFAMSFSLDAPEKKWGEVTFSGQVSCKLP